ncbi:Ubiquitin-conjugating enzyme E2 6 [Blastocladiella emersonii ATCC 22665]|nr:Ubiquitin-conjugating enzyme E2 6 [Blastocladiella emersonii ATCC 22665]
MATQAAYKRLTKEYKAIVASPPPLITARPLDSNILCWHFLMHGPPDTPFAGGVYWGQLNFPPEYPFAPPSIRVTTPNGRFKPGERICMSMSDYHPDTWNPGWSVATILSGLLSFMVVDEMAAGTVKASAAERQALARVSVAWNRKQKAFADVWPEFLEGEMAFGGSYDGTADAPTPTSTTAAAEPPAPPTVAAVRRRVPSVAVVAPPPPTTAATAAQPVPPVQQAGIFARYKWLLLGFALWVYLVFHRIVMRLGTAAGGHHHDAGAGASA